MRLIQICGAVALAGVLGGCVAAPTGTSVSSEQMGFACIAAVEMQTNNHDVRILGSDPRGDGRDFTLEVGGTGVWSCVVTQSGVVTSVGLLGSDGSSLA